MADLRGLNRYKGTAKATHAGFTNFMWVLGQQADGTSAKLARASQPHYLFGDRDHSLDADDIKFLKDNKFSCVISANSRFMSAASIKALQGAYIEFYHFKTGDFQAPSKEQLLRAASLIALFGRRGPVLVYCGYGEGRTGTFIATWAMLKYLGPKGVDIDPLCTTGNLERHFGVEEPAQVSAVRKAVGLPEVQTGPAGPSLPLFSGPAFTGAPFNFSGGGLPVANFSSGPWVPAGANFSSGPGVAAGAKISSGQSVWAPAFAKFSSGDF